MVMMLCFFLLCTLLFVLHETLTTHAYISAYRELTYMTHIISSVHVHVHVYTCGNEMFILCMSQFMLVSYHPIVHACITYMYQCMINDTSYIN